ncbi:MAG: type II toxin-antitoxin system VapC family toxin [Cyanobacteria bacterium REEB65]|nr:type II toxin-antitoxin system VapC family toxin [Cyanobacteria bacterium REEB65]
MTVLLDTCAFLWAIVETSKLSPAAADLLRDPATDALLSVVSAWEIAAKNASGKLPLPEPPRSLVPKARQALSLQSLSLDEPACLQLDRLPLLHRDPFDRMLICQAIAAGIPILTPDSLIAQYPIRTIW